MAAKVISIEIGRLLTRVCEVDYKAKTHRVHKYFTIPTPEGVVSDGVLSVTPEYTEALKTAIAENNMKARQVVFTLTSGRIASREVVIPLVRENRIADVVKANAADYFPVDLGQYRLAYSILGTVEDTKGTQQYKLLVLAAPSSLLDGYYSLAKALKLETAAIDYAGNSVFQAVKDKTGEGTDLVIKADEGSTLIMAVRGRTLVFTRNVAYGVEEAIEAVIESGRWREADTVGKAMEIMSANDCTALAEVTEALHALTGGVSRVVDYYMSHNSGTAIGHVYMTGLGANIKGLSDLFSRELNLPVEVLREVPGWNFEKSFQTPFYGEYVACAGAGASPLGFRKEEKSDKPGRNGKGGVNGAAVAYILLVMGLAISVALAGFSAWRYMDVSKLNMELKTQSDGLASIVPVYDEYADTLVSYHLAMAVYAVTENRNEELVEFLEELESKMPADVRVVSLTSTAEGVAINMSVGTKSEVALAIEQLRTFASLYPSSVTVNSVVEETDEEAGTLSVNFSVSAAYRDIHDAGGTADMDGMTGIDGKGMDGLTDGAMDEDEAADIDGLMDSADDAGQAQEVWQ